MTTKSRWHNGILEYYDGATFEHIPSTAPVQFYDDFLGAQGLAAIPAASSEERGVDWCSVIVGAAPPTVANVADAANGVVACALTSASQAQDAVLYWGDQHALSVANGGILEFRAALSVLPTTGVTVVAGLIGDHDLDKDTVAVSAWFRWQASAAGLVETDDTTNDEDDISTGLTTVVSTMNIYRIDLTDLTSVKFYVDGVRVAASTTFDMSNLTAAEKIMQPYFSLDKASGTGVGTLQIDYVRFWGRRG